jgi:hypothetical protein
MNDRPIGSLSVSATKNYCMNRSVDTPKFADRDWILGTLLKSGIVAKQAPASAGTCTVQAQTVRTDHRGQTLAHCGTIDDGKRRRLGELVISGHFSILVFHTYAL